MNLQILNNNLGSKRKKQYFNLKPNFYTYTLKLEYMLIFLFEILHAFIADLSCVTFSTILWFFFHFSLYQLNFFILYLTSMLILRLSVVIFKYESKICLIVLQ